jgi:hypothetical protein
MQQRVYRDADIPPQDLAASLVAQYAQTRRMRAKTLGSGESEAVQIGREGRAPAMNLGIVRSPEAEKESSYAGTSDL